MPNSSNLVTVKCVFSFLIWILVIGILGVVKFDRTVALGNAHTHTHTHVSPWSLFLIEVELIYKLLENMYGESGENSLGELTENLYIPKYTQVSADFGDSVIYYATRNDCVITAGQLEVEVPFIQGIVTTLNLTVKELKISSVYNLLSKNVAEDSVILKVGDEVWEEVDDAYLVINPGKIYSVHDSKTDDCYIQFGSGFKDILPNDESTVVTITYLNSLGAEGQIRAGSINKLHSDIMYQGFSIADDLVITNYDNSSGGSERESILNARVNSRALLKTTDAAITLPDYEALTNSFNGVCKSKAIDWTVEGTDIGVPYYIRVYVLPTDDDMCSPQQLTDIKDFLYTKKISSMTVEVVTAIIDEVDIDAVVYTNAHSTEYEAIRQSVVQALETYFDRYSRSFGELIRPNKLLNVIEDANDLIDFGDINLPSSSIKLGLGHFPMLGTVNITVEPVGGE